MTDYSQNEDYSAKDALASGEAEKIILGTDIDSELAEISTAIATKFDSSDIASQAQAEAGASNEVLITPLRLAQFFSGNADSGTAGALSDIGALDDPGDDRLLYWDEAIDAMAWLDVGNGLEVTAGSVLNVAEPNVNHDALGNFVADKHIAHSSVTLTAGEGLTGGGTIAASRSFALNVSGLTEELTIDAANDLIVFYDASATAHRKVQIDSLLGARVGDGRWQRSTIQSLPAGTLVTVLYASTSYDALERGTFNTVTSEYTAGENGARVLVSASIRVSAQNPNSDVELMIQKNGSNQANAITHFGSTSTGPADSITQTSVTMTLNAGDVVRVQARSSNEEVIAASTSGSFISIVELA